MHPPGYLVLIIRLSRKDQASLLFPLFCVLVVLTACKLFLWCAVYVRCMYTGTTFGSVPSRRSRQNLFAVGSLLLRLCPPDSGGLPECSHSLPRATETVSGGLQVLMSWHWSDPFMTTSTYESYLGSCELATAFCDVSLLHSLSSVIAWLLLSYISCIQRIIHVTL